MEDFSKYDTNYLIRILKGWKGTSVYNDIMDEILYRAIKKGN